MSARLSGSVLSALVISNALGESLTKMAGYNVAMSGKETGADGDPVRTQGATLFLVRVARPADSLGAVLILTVLDYVAVSTLRVYLWGKVVVTVLLGSTLLMLLRTSRSRRLWQVLAALFFGASTAGAVGSIFVVGVLELGQTATVVGWLLLVAPTVILRRTSMHRSVTTEAVLGAVCVYLLIGFSFSAIYAAIDLFSVVPFFTELPHATINDYLFFSYTTLTTEGYGNLVPAGHLGQTFAMIEALAGQIYLVIVVARLVSLWARGPSPPNERKAPPGVEQGTGGVSPEPSREAG
jgi:hypothetical protein